MQESADTESTRAAQTRGYPSVPPSVWTIPHPGAGDCSSSQLQRTSEARRDYHIALEEEWRRLAGRGSECAGDRGPAHSPWRNRGLSAVQRTEAITDFGECERAPHRARPSSEGLRVALSDNGGTRAPL